MVATLHEALFSAHQILRPLTFLFDLGLTVVNYRWIEVMIMGLNAIFYVCTEPTTRLNSIGGDLVRIAKFILAEAIKMRRIHEDLNVVEPK